MTSARRGLKMSSVDKNLRNSEMGEVWARMNKTLTHIVGLGLTCVGGKNRGSVSASLSGVPTAPTMLTTPHHFLHRHTMMVLFTLTPTPCPFPQTHTPFQKGACEFFEGGQPFISMFPASSTMFACGRNPVNVC